MKNRLSLIYSRNGSLIPNAMEIGTKESKMVSSGPHDDITMEYDRRATSLVFGFKRVRRLSDTL